MHTLLAAGLAPLDWTLSLFNSCATLFTVDICEKPRPGRSEAELVRVVRWATGAVVL